MSKDLTHEAPRGPRTRLGNYVILARALDKGRAELDGKGGDYHFDCPLDNMLFGFKGVAGADVKQLLADGASDEEVVAWLDSHGTPKTPEELAKWSAEMEAFLPTHNADLKEFFDGECQRLGLDKETTTLFDYLEVDDRATYATA